MAGVDVEKNGAREHAEDRCGEAGRRVKTAGGEPQIEKETEQENMQGHHGVDGLGERKGQKQEIGGIEQGRLEAAEEGRARKQVGIPQGQIPRPYLIDGELPPVQKLV